jgi:ParB family chromosome partitioning protein
MASESSSGKRVFVDEKNERPSEPKGGILRDALAELDSTLAGSAKSILQSKKEVTGSEVKAASGQKVTPMANAIKGANLSRKKNVLGRGLSALMQASEVSVEPVSSEKGTQGNSAQTTSASRHPWQDAEREVAPQASKVERASSVEASEQNPPEESLSPAGGLFYLSIDKVFRNTEQPRQYFAEAEIEELSSSIKKSGLLQPIIVRRRAQPEGSGEYEIVAGERRWRAAQLAELTRIPALVRDLSDRETLELGIVENVQRSDLNPVEEALAYQRLISDFGATQEQVATTVGKDRASVANTLRLLKLAPKVQEMLAQKELSAGHGRTLLAVSSPAEQRKLAERIVADSLSVRAVERIVKEGNEFADAKVPSGRKAKTNVSTKEATPAMKALEDRFRRALGTKVQLISSGEGSGELRISYFSEEELTSLMDRLGA